MSDRAAGAASGGAAGTGSGGAAGTGSDRAAGAASGGAAGTGSGGAAGPGSGGAAGPGSGGAAGTGAGGAGVVGFRVDAGPAGTRFTEVRHLTEVDSTNRYLLDEARAGAPEGLVVIADHQTAGRGRLDRRWEAPAGANLLLSVLLRPNLAVDELHLCSAVVALAASAACDAAAGLVSMLKWPNDIIVAERKLAGVLAESAPAGPGTGTGWVVVVGLGLNVAWPPPDGEPGAALVPEELVGSATSLWRETGHRHDVAVLADAVLRDLEPRLCDLAEPAGRRRQESEYRRRCVTLGRAVSVSLLGESFSGTAVDVTPEGHLVVDVGGRRVTVTAGDVVHLRVRH